MSGGLHTPERLAGESFDAYKVRRRESQIAAAESIYRAASDWPSGKVHRKPRESGQHPKFSVERVRKPKKPVAPTWPRTLDQERQSRPVHVLHPNREPDASKRCKPKSAVAKRMDRPERVAAIDRGHRKLMRFFGA